MAFSRTVGSLGFTLGLVVLCSCNLDGFSSMCSGGHLSVTSGVVTTPAYDSVEIFVDGEVVDSTGTPCANATNDECLTEYRSVAKMYGARWVTTRGNEIKIRSQVNREDLGDSTDTPEEATLVVMGWSLASACKAFDTIEARTVPGGFEVVATKPLPLQSCETEVRRTTPVDQKGNRSATVEEVSTGLGCDGKPIKPWGRTEYTGGRAVE